MSSSKASSSTKKFIKMGLDDRILEGITRMKWKLPTRVQEKAIPYVLDGKTVIAEARTGSGKTGAYLIPSLHRILVEKRTATTQSIRMMILAPTKELCRQISKMAEHLVSACRREIKILDLSPHVSLGSQRAQLQDNPDVIVGPPRRILAHIQEGNLSLSEIMSVIVDEADLMLAFNHNDTIVELWKYLPTYFQTFITSATLGKDMKYIKNFLCVGEGNIEELTKNLVILRLKEPPLPSGGQLKHFVIKLEDFEKSILLVHIMKNNLLSGKTIIFVNEINKAYRLRMFMGQFSIPTCILNCELPAASRFDIIEQFNSGIFDIIIAVDDESLKKANQLKGVSVDEESGTSRGLDFQFVSNIINFDFPKTTVSYIHRVGRTARFDNQGTALNMVSKNQLDFYEAVKDELSELMEESEISGTNYEGIFKKFNFDMNDYDVIRYRAEDPWRACTVNKVMSARKREISQQLLNSKKLSTYFKANPREYALLKHTKTQHGIKNQCFTKSLPAYNMSNAPDEEVNPDTSNKALKKIKKSKGDIRKKKFKKMTKNQQKKKVQMNDPLKKMKFSGFC